MVDYEQLKIQHERGEIDAAIEGYMAMLNENCDNEEVLVRLGGALLQKRQFGLAINVLREAGAINPDEPAVYQNIGTCYRRMSQYDDAENAYRQGIAVGIKWLEGKMGTAGESDARDLLSQIYANLAGLMVNNGTPEEALMIYRQGLDIEPSNPIIKYNQCYPLLEMFNWREGWPMYHAGFTCGTRRTRNYHGVPEWDGSPGKRIIVWGDQGIGDEIMFASCIPDLVKVSEKVIFDCHPRLVKTFQRSLGIECHGTRKNAQHVEWLAGSGANASVCVTDLPMYYRLDDADFPGHAYLKAPKIVLPGAARGRKAIGISWKGGSGDTRGDVRSVTLDVLKPILEQNADFYSLQYTDGASKEVCEFEANTGIHVKHFPQYAETKNYDVTMSMIKSLDLVITVCTSAVHAAGSLGVPCWVLTPSKPAWRYGVKGKGMPWYNSVELFRQKPGSPWSEVIENVNGRLSEFLDEKALKLA